MNKSDTATFYIVRHGETDWNAKRIIQGQLDIPLNEKGELQAKELAKELKNVKFDLAFSSDLLRAKYTAELIMLEHNVTVQTTEILRERMFGKLEGKSTDKLRELFADLSTELSHEERLRHKYDEEIESDEQMISRIITFIRETAVANPGQNILLGTHGGIIKVLLVHLGYLSYKNMNEFRITNTGYVILESDGVEFKIQKVHGLRKIKEFEA